MTIKGRKLVQREIAQEYRRWKRKLHREPTKKERAQIVAIGFSKARKRMPSIPVAANPLDGREQIGADAAMREMERLAKSIVQAHQDRYPEKAAELWRQYDSTRRSLETVTGTHMIGIRYENALRGKIKGFSRAAKFAYEAYEDLKKKTNPLVTLPEAVVMGPPGAVPMVNPSYVAIEMDPDTGIETGNVESYSAETPEGAALNLLYTKRLSDGNARLGPTKRVVYSKGKAWSIVPAKQWGPSTNNPSIVPAVIAGATSAVVSRVLQNPRNPLQNPAVIRGPIAWEELSKREKLEIDEQEKHLSPSVRVYDKSGTYWVKLRYHRPGTYPIEGWKQSPSPEYFKKEKYETFLNPALNAQYVHQDAKLWDVIKIGRSKYRAIGRDLRGVMLWKGSGPTIYVLIEKAAGEWGLGRFDDKAFAQPIAQQFSRLSQEIKRHVRAQQRGEVQPNPLLMTVMGANPGKNPITPSDTLLVEMLEDFGPLQKGLGYFARFKNGGTSGYISVYNGNTDQYIDVLATKVRLVTVPTRYKHWTPKRFDKMERRPSTHSESFGDPVLGSWVWSPLDEEMYQHGFTHRIRVTHASGEKENLYFKSHEEGMKERPWFQRMYSEVEGPYELKPPKGFSQANPIGETHRKRRDYKFLGNFYADSQLITRLSSSWKYMQPPLDIISEGGPNLFDLYVHRKDWDRAVSMLKRIQLDISSGHNPDGWVVTHDGETLKVFGSEVEAVEWMHGRHGYSIDHAVRHEGYDILHIVDGKVVYSYKRERPKENPRYPGERRSFQDFLSRKKSEYGEQFDPSDLAPQFIPYYESGKRIEVDFGYERRRGRVGVTTGWKPTFLLMLTTRSRGSSYTLGKNDKVVRVVSENPGVEFEQPEGTSTPEFHSSVSGGARRLSFATPGASLRVWPLHPARGLESGVYDQQTERRSYQYGSSAIVRDVYDNPKAVHDEIVKAFLSGRPRRLAGGRYETDGRSLRVWGNLVAERRPEGLYITDAGWRTLLTKNTLNTVLRWGREHGFQGGSIYQKASVWYFKPEAPGAKPIPWSGGMVLGMSSVAPVTVPAANPRACPNVCLNPMHGHVRRISSPAKRRAPVAGSSRGRAASNKYSANPIRKKVTMSLAKFSELVKRQRDPQLWRDLQKKIQGYRKWTHGTMPRTVTVEMVRKPGVKGMWISYDAGRQPESTYIMPGGSKRKGAWKHPWDTMPSIKNDPEAGIILTKLKGRSRISDFYHR